MVTVLSWVAFISSVVLFVIKIWNAYDAYLDWKAAVILEPGSPQYEVAWGEFRIVWLRIIFGLLWLFLGALLAFPSVEGDLISEFDVVRRGLLRLVVTLMIWIELVRVLNERVVRMRVLQGLKNKLIKGTRHD